MRTLLSAPLLVYLLLGWGVQAQTQDDARAIIDKAIKAHGGVETLTGIKAGQTRSKGRIELDDGITFTQQVIYQLPNQFKEVTEVEVAGRKGTVTTVFNGEKVWISLDGKDLDVDEKVLAEMKAITHLFRVGRLTYLLEDKGFKLSPLGEIKVNGKPSVGVRVEYKGCQDISLYFDKDTNLLVKSERRALDLTTLKEVTEERIVTEFQKVGSLPSPKKVVVNRDGKKLLEVEVIEIKVLAKVDPGTFTKP